MEPFTSEPCGAVKCVVQNRNEGYCSINIELTTLNSKLAILSVKFTCVCVFLHLSYLLLFVFVLFVHICLCYIIMLCLCFLLHRLNLLYVPVYI